MAVFERFENQEVRQLKWAVASDSATTFAVGDVVSYTPATKAISKLDSQAAIKTAFSNGLEVYVIAQGDMITYNIPTDYKTYKITDSVNASIGNIDGEKIVVGYLVRSQTNVKFIVGFAIAPLNEADEVYGKKVSDLQSGVTISDGMIYGVSKYVADYSSAGFEGAGNYIAFRANFGANATVKGYKVTAAGTELNEVTIPADDRDCVFVLKDHTGTNTDEIVKLRFKVTENGVIETFDYSLANLVKETN